jgi:hypothetical protein
MTKRNADKARKSGLRFDAVPVVMSFVRYRFSVKGMANRAYYQTLDDNHGEKFKTPGPERADAKPETLQQKEKSLVSVSDGNRLVDTMAITDGINLRQSGKESL